MINPCPSKLDCPDAVNPLGNFTSERPEPVINIARISSQFTFGDPALGSNFVSTGCVGTCVAPTQEEADACALAQVVGCVQVHNKVPPDEPLVDPPGVPPESPNPPPVFGNTAQTCNTLCPDGLPFSFTVPAGRFFASSQALANAMAFSDACNKAIQNRVCIDLLTPNEGCINEPFSASISQTGASAPFTWTKVSGPLQAGLTFNSDGTITGTPTAGGPRDFVVQLTDSRGNFMRKQFTLSIAQITTSSPLPGATLATAYSTSLVAIGTVGQRVWTISSGALPDGLSLNSGTGIISGTPTTAGTFSFDVTVTDAKVSCSKPFQMTVHSSCVDWDSIAWNAPNLAFTPPAIATGSSAGPNWAAEVQSLFAEPGAQTILEGFFDYNGPGCTAQLEVVIEITTANPADGLTANLNIRNDTTGNPLFFNTNVNASAVGTYDFPIVFPDTGGVSNTFHIIFTFAANGLLFHPDMHLKLHGTFSNP